MRGASHPSASVLVQLPWLQPNSAMGLTSLVPILRRGPHLGTSGRANKLPSVDKCWEYLCSRESRIQSGVLGSHEMAGLQSCCCVLWGRDVGVGVKKRNQASGLASLCSATGWVMLETVTSWSPFRCPKHGVGWLVTKGSSALTFSTSNYKIIFIFALPPVI